MATPALQQAAAAKGHFDNLYRISMESTDSLSLSQNYTAMTGICDQIKTISLTPHLDNVRKHRTHESNFTGQEELVNEMSAKAEAVYTRLISLQGSSSSSLYPQLPSFVSATPVAAQSQPARLEIPPSPKKSMFDRLRERFFGPREPDTTQRPPSSVDLSSGPSTGSVFSPPGFVGIAAPLEVGVGFENMSCNCWGNALLEMVIQEPHLRLAYETVANHYSTSDQPWIGTVLMGALEAYQACFVQQLAENKARPVPALVSQNVRAAFHFMFQDPVTGAPAFSNSQYRQEDAAEALMCLLARYADILGEDNPPSFFFDLRTTRQFAPIGAPYPTTKAEGYSELVNNQVTHTEKEFQILLDLQAHTHTNFEGLFNQYFSSNQVLGSQQANYLVGDDLLQQFIPVREEQQLLSAPTQLLLTLKRFGRDMAGTVCKISNEIDVPLILELPPQATQMGTRARYELSSFIVHRGTSLNSGHYLCYRKIDGEWYEFNDRTVARMEESWIQSILKQSYIHQYTRLPEMAAPAAPIHSSSTPDPEPAAPLYPVIEPCYHTLEKYTTVVAQLKALQSLDGAQLQEALQTVGRIEPAILQQLEFSIWLHDLMPSALGYGTRVLQTNPGSLKLITAPLIWHTEPASHLLEQMVHLYEEKYGIENLQAATTKLEGDSQEVVLSQLQAAENQLIGHKLRTFSQLLESPGFNNEQLSIAFKLLDIPSSYKERIYQEIHPVYGEATMKDNPRYLVELKNQGRDILGQLAGELA